MLPNSLHIDGDMGEILAHCGFQSDDPSGANYVQYGVNWGYTGSQLTENMDPITVLLVVVVLVLILLTGYLIIYNVFQISVANDIRFYGLLKTIGTTGRQIKAMLRQSRPSSSAAWASPLGWWWAGWWAASSPRR